MGDKFPKHLVNPEVFKDRKVKKAPKTNKLTLLLILFFIVIILDVIISNLLIFVFSNIGKYDFGENYISNFGYWFLILLLPCAALTGYAASEGHFFS